MVADLVVAELVAVVAELVAAPLDLAALAAMVAIELAVVAEHVTSARLGPRFWWWSPSTPRVVADLVVAELVAVVAELVAAPLDLAALAAMVAIELAVVAEHVTSARLGPRFWWWSPSSPRW